MTNELIKNRDSQPIFYEWECPLCGEISEDPIYYTYTTCSSGHMVELHSHNDETHTCIAKQHNQ